jgi:dimethylhistidine N-methyltransferase
MNASLDLREKPARENRAPADLAFFEDLEPPLGDFLADASAGLASAPKTLSPKYFYDQRGSELFEGICETREYYVTRTEIALLEKLGPAFAEKAGKGARIIEYGSGAGVKIRTLLDALDEPAAYIAIDISREHLLGATRTLAADYPRIAMGAICADFTAPLTLPPEAAIGNGLALGFLPGSTIGNFSPEMAELFLSRIAAMLGKGGALLIGVDLKKDKAVLDAAYNDAAGLTAAFNLNILRRMQNELGATLEPDNFMHKAFFNEEKGRIEMHLESLCDQAVELGGTRYPFAKGETLHTENSHKYTVEEFTRLAEKAGFAADTVWTDENDYFSLHWLNVAA